MEEDRSAEKKVVSIKPTREDIKSKFVLLGLSIINLCLEIWKVWR